MPLEVPRNIQSRLQSAIDNPDDAEALHRVCRVLTVWEPQDFALELLKQLRAAMPADPIDISKVLEPVMPPIANEVCDRIRSRSLTSVRDAHLRIEARIVESLQVWRSNSNLPVKDHNSMPQLYPRSPKEIASIVSGLYAIADVIAQRECDLESAHEVAVDALLATYRWAVKQYNADLIPTRDAIINHIAWEIRGNPLMGRKAVAEYLERQSRELPLDDPQSHPNGTRALSPIDTLSLPGLEEEYIRLESKYDNRKAYWTEIDAALARLEGVKGRGAIHGTITPADIETLNVLLPYIQNKRRQCQFDDDFAVGLKVFTRSLVIDPEALIFLRSRYRGHRIREAIVNITPILRMCDMEGPIVGLRADLHHRIEALRDLTKQWPITSEMEKKQRTLHAVSYWYAAMLNKMPRHRQATLELPPVLIKNRLHPDAHTFLQAALYPQSCDGILHTRLRHVLDLLNLHGLIILDGPCEEERVRVDRLRQTANRLWKDKGQREMLLDICAYYDDCVAKARRDGTMVIVPSLVTTEDTREEIDEELEHYLMATLPYRPRLQDESEGHYYTDHQSWVCQRVRRLKKALELLGFTTTIPAIENAL